MSKDAVWSYKVPGVHCAVLAEVSWLYAPGLLLTMGIFEIKHGSYKKQPQPAYPHFFNWSQLLYVYCALSFSK